MTENYTLKSLNHSQSGKATANNARMVHQKKQLCDEKLLASHLDGLLIIGVLSVLSDYPFKIILQLILKQDECLRTEVQLLLCDPHGC